MIRKAILLAAVVAVVLLSMAPASAMCTAGRIGIEKGKPVVELPRCETYPQ